MTAQPDAGQPGAADPGEPAEDRVLLDNRHVPCAVGLIKAARTMAGLPMGTVLEIWSRDRFAPMEIPLWAQTEGHEVEALGMQGQWPNRHYIFKVTKRKERRPSRPAGQG